MPARMTTCRWPACRRPQWRGVIDVSLTGFYAVTQPLLLPMMATRWGRIIALSSVTAQFGNRGQANYGAAKAGLEGAVRSLSREVASRGITVNAVAPGVIASPAVDAVMDAAAIARIVPMKRAGRAEEVADLVGFLASDGRIYLRSDDRDQWRHGVIPRAAAPA